MNRLQDSSRRRDKSEHPGPMSPMTSIPVFGVSVAIESLRKPLEFFMGSGWIATIQVLPESIRRCRGQRSARRRKKTKLT